MKAKLYTIGCWIGCGCSTAFWSCATILASVVPRGGMLRHLCMRRWAKDNLWLSRTRVEIEGLENIEHALPQIFVANHSGFHDILVLAGRLPVQFLWVAKKSLFKVPFMGWAMSRSGFIPIDRDNPRKAAKSIIEAARIIQGGVSAVAFPEGTRSRTGDLGAFHSGAFALALRTGVPLVPISLEGSFRTIMPKTLGVSPGTIIRVKIGRPIDLANYARSDKQKLMHDVSAVMSRDLEELRSRRRPGEEGADPVFRWIHGRERRRA